MLVLDANPEITSKKGLFEKAFKEHYSGIVEYRPDAELRELAGNVARLDFEDVRADVLNVIPPQRAADLALRTGLLNMNDRWAGVNWLTMESTAAPNIHVLGDAHFPGAGHAQVGAHGQSAGQGGGGGDHPAAQGRAVNPTPVVANTCYSFVTGDQAMHVASVHQYDAKEKTFKAVPGSSGVSAAASQAEGRYALGWAANIWADSLAL